MNQHAPSTQTSTDENSTASTAQDGRRPVRFIILSESRSGSGLLVSMLRTHPNVICHGEALHRKAVAALPPLDQTSLEERNSDLKGFVERMYAFGEQNPECAAVGFKLFYYHKPLLLRRLIKDGGIRFIVLWRDDKLARYASRQIALKTGRWVESSGTEPKANSVKRPDTVRYHYWGHLLHFLFSACCFRITMAMLGRSQSRYLVVRFEKLVEAKDVWGRRIQQFLDLQPVELQPGTHRQNAPDPFQRFQNPQAARRGLAIQQALTKLAIEWAPRPRR